MLTHEEIIASVTKAFAPLRCVAQIWDYDSKLRFRISDETKAILRMDEIDLRYAQDKELLESVLRNVRSRVESKGFVLN